MEQVKQLPLPYFKINEHYKILAMSDASSELFTPEDNLLTLIDKGSRKKAKAMITPEKQINSTEIVFQTKEDSLAVFQVDVKWRGNEGNIICNQLKEQMEDVSDQLQQLWDRLAETDFALLEKKEELDRAIDRANKLSGSFIPLSDEVALVPLFGDLVPEKLAVITDGIVTSLYNSNYRYILFDFTAVYEISREGINGLEELFRTIRVMGQETVVCGIKPQHAQVINNYEWFLHRKH